jgi:hypothetical protein
VGEDSKGSAPSRGSENIWLGTSKTHHVSIHPQENRRSSKSEMGEGESGEEEIGGIKQGFCRPYSA